MNTPPPISRPLVVLALGLLTCLCLSLCLLGGLFGYGTLQATRSTPLVRDPDVTPFTTAVPDEPRPTRTAQAAAPTPRPATGNSAIADETLAAIEAEALPQRDLFELAERYGRIPPDSPRTVSGPDYQLGDTERFTISDEGSGSFEAVAVLRAQSDHASWWVEEGANVAQSDLEASVRRFEEQSYPTNRAAFGSEWSPGVDGDERLHIYLGRVPGVGGYFSSADEFPRSVIESSNEKEIFYINLENAGPGNDYFDGILAHEFQHMIHWNVDRNEETWVNEGLSELAAHINGLDVDSAATSFARQPDIPVTRWAQQSYPFYGSAFLIELYLYERYGAEVVKALVEEPLDGPAAFDAVLAPHGSRFDQFYGDWMVAMLLDDESVADGRFVFRDEDPGTLAEEETVQRFPATSAGSVNQYGIDRIEYEAEGGATPLQLSFSGDPFTTLLPTAPHGGDWALWGNRGDDSHAVVSRAFDLTGLSSATLRFWSWYQLEEDFDYAYVTVSTDGGTTWAPLEASETTTSNPNGNSFGAALTGSSGGWTQQEVDLTPYAGKALLIAFEVVTDDALNEPGLFVDDIELPELNYREDFEGGLGGWETLGFVRVGTVLPQHWLVRAVAQGPSGPQLLDVPLSEDGSGTLTVPGFGAEVESVTLLVTATTHAATSKGNYRIEATTGP